MEAGFEPLATTTPQKCCCTTAACQAARPTNLDSLVLWQRIMALNAAVMVTGRVQTVLVLAVEDPQAATVSSCVTPQHVGITALAPTSGRVSAASATWDRPASTSVRGLRPAATMVRAQNAGRVSVTLVTMVTAVVRCAAALDSARLKSACVTHATWVSFASLSVTDTGSASMQGTTARDVGVTQAGRETSAPSQHVQVLDRCVQDMEIASQLLADASVSQDGQGQTATPQTALASETATTGAFATGPLTLHGA